MNSNVLLKILKERSKLEKLILKGEPYEKICKKSQELDELIVMQFKVHNKIC